MDFVRRWRGCLLLSWALTGCLNRSQLNVNVDARLSVAPATLPADGATPAVVSIAVDAAGPRGLVGAALSLTADAEGAQIEAAASLDALGRSQATVRCSRAGLYILRAWLKGGLRGPVPARGDVRLTCTAPTSGGPASLATSQLSADPNRVAADGTSTSLLTLRLHDSLGQPLGGAPVAWSSTGTQNLFSDSTGFTDAAGVATTTLASTVLERKQVTASAGGVTLVTPVDFVDGAVSVALSTFIASPTLVAADGISTALLTLQVRDAVGNGIPGVAVGLGATGSNILLVAGGAATDAGGVLTATLASTAAGSKVVTATLPGTSLSVTVQFAAGAPSAGQSTLAAVGPSSALADGAAAVVLRATLRDANGNPVPGQSVTLTSSAGGTTLTPGSGATDASGVFTAVATSTAVSSVTVRLGAAGTVVATTDIAFTAGPASTVTSTFSAAPTMAVADGVAAVTLTLTARDAQGHLLPGRALTLNASGAGDVLSATSGTTDAGGSFVATLRSTTAESKTVTATLGGVSVTTGVTFVGGTATQLSLSGLHGGSAAVVATARITALDAFNNVAPGYRGPVRFSSTDPNALLPGNYTFTAADSGVHDFNNGVTLKTAGTQSVTVTDANTTSLTATTANLTVTGGLAASLVLTGISKAMAAGESSSLTVTVYDGYGNLATAYRGTVRFTSSDALATVPSDYTFTGTDSGKHVFDANAVTLKSVGTQSVTGTDASNSVTGSLTGIAVDTVKAIGSGEDSNGPCAILSTGAVKCWGYNRQGELGYGDTQDRGGSPAHMGGGLPAISLGSGNTAVSVSTNCSDSGAGGHTCAVLNGGSVKCWGANGSGDLGYGDTLQRKSPSAAVLDFGLGRTVKSLGTTCRGGCALLDDATVKCWGNNVYGELGLGDAVQRSQPGGAALLGANRTAVSVVTGATSVCALLDNGDTKCWGNNTYGQLGLGDTLPRSNPSTLPAVSLGAGRTAQDLGVMAEATCAALDDGTVKCWGHNGLGALGLGDTLDRNAPSSAVSGLLAPVQGLVGGAHHVCAILADGRLQCWGRNAFGQLGLGDSTDRLTAPAEVSLGTGRTANDVMLGNYFTCALLDNLTVKCWGANYIGALGLGDVTNRGDEPSQMGSSLPVVSLW
jgi:alpha-tubulin suppressor-like RCC1 family protein